MTVTDKPWPIQLEQQQSKPRAYKTHTDNLPQVFRPGSLDALQLPRIHGGYRVYKDGRKEKL